MMGRWHAALRRFVRRFGLRVLSKNSYFLQYVYSDINDDWVSILSGVRPWVIDFRSMYVSLDEYDSEEKCLQPLIVDESYEFHRYMMSRCDAECAVHGLITVIDWLYFFVSIAEEKKITLMGLKALKHIVDECGTPFIEERRKKFAYDKVKESYIMPTQVECCLQLCLLELDLRNDLASDSVEFRISLDHIKRYVDSAGGFSAFEPYLRRQGDGDDGFTIVFSFRRMLLGYFRHLLPWPTMQNNKLRHVIAWVVKYFAFFSEKFVCLYYGSEVFDAPGNIPVKKGVLKKFENPNLMFLWSTSIFGEMRGMSVL